MALYFIRKLHIAFYAVIAYIIHEVKRMADYKEMYLVLARATEQAIRILIEAQQQCEALYIDTDCTPVIQIINADHENNR